jgi:two-component system response regulator DevR
MTVPRRAQIRVLLVDDHGLVRIGLREQLASCRDFSVVGEAASVAQAVELARRLIPEIVLLDLNLPDGSGIQACRQILADAPASRMLILTIDDDSAAVRAAVEAGAHGYVLKDIGRDMLIQAVRTVATGASYFHPRLLRAVLSGSSADSGSKEGYGLEKLSRQEQRILRLLEEGKTNKEIGLAMALSGKTVRNYLANMFKKLKISRRTQAVTLYVRGQKRRDHFNAALLT